MDELKTIEAYTGELEALRNYDRIKKERDELAERCSKLETGISELNGELISLKGFKIEFVGKELTLQQAKTEFVDARKHEIEKEANERYLKLKSGYESRMPELIFERLIEIVKKPPWPGEIASAMEAKAKEIADGILQNKERWPGWFKKFYLEEVRAGVSAGLNEEFERKVEMEATTRAEKKLKELATVEWPNWYNANIKPKLSDLEAKIEENAIGVLRGPWCNIRCDRCGTELGEIELTEQGISDLLSRGHIEIDCINPDCRDYGLRKHKIKVSFQNLIAGIFKAP